VLHGALHPCPTRRSSDLPRRALTGLTAEARRAGVSPKRNTTAQANTREKAITRQSAGRTSRARYAGGLIIPTMMGADHHAKTHRSEEHTSELQSRVELVC